MEPLNSISGPLSFGDKIGISAVCGPIGPKFRLMADFVPSMNISKNHVDSSKYTAVMALFPKGNFCPNRFLVKSGTKSPPIPDLTPSAPPNLGSRKLFGFMHFRSISNRLGAIAVLKYFPAYFPALLARFPDFLKIFDYFSDVAMDQTLQMSPCGPPRNTWESWKIVTKDL